MFRAVHRVNHIVRRTSVAKLEACMLADGSRLAHSVRSKTSSAISHAKGDIEKPSVSAARRESTSAKKAGTGLKAAGQQRGGSATKRMPRNYRNDTEKRDITSFLPALPKGFDDAFTLGAAIQHYLNHHERCTPHMMAARIEEVDNLLSKKMAPKILDAAVYNQFIAILVREGKLRMAKQMILQMKKRGVKPTIQTYGTFLHALTIHCPRSCSQAQLATWSRYAADIYTAYLQFLSQSSDATSNPAEGQPGIPAVNYLQFLNRHGLIDVLNSTFSSLKENYPACIYSSTVSIMLTHLASQKTQKAAEEASLLWTELQDARFSNLVKDARLVTNCIQVLCHGGEPEHMAAHKLLQEFYEPPHVSSENRPEGSTKFILDDYALETMLNLLLKHRRYDIIRGLIDHFFNRKDWQARIRRSILDKMMYACRKETATTRAQRLMRWYGPSCKATAETWTSLFQNCANAKDWRLIKTYWPSVQDLPPTTSMITSVMQAAATDKAIRESLNMIWPFANKILSPLPEDHRLRDVYERAEFARVLLARRHHMPKESDEVRASAYKISTSDKHLQELKRKNNPTRKWNFAPSARAKQNAIKGRDNKPLEAISSAAFASPTLPKRKKRSTKKVIASPAPQEISHIHSSTLQAT